MARVSTKRSLKRLLLLLALFLVVDHLVLPQLAGARRAVDVLDDVQPAWLVAGVLLEMLSVVAFARLTWTLLPPQARPSMPTTIRITLSTLGLSHVIPGGTAAGTSLGYRLLTNAGASGPEAAFAIASQGLGSAVVLNVVLWGGLIVSIPARGFDPLYATAAILGGLLLALVGVAILLATRGEDRVISISCRVAGHLPFVDEDTVAGALQRVAEQLRTLMGQPRLLLKASFWAAANWVLDMAALAVFLAAFGATVPVDGLVVAYGVAYVLAAIPITPGGLGVVEATLTALLVGFGVPRGQALVGVVSYRVANFWLPIPAGAAAYLALKVTDLRDRRRIRELEELASGALEEAPTARQWAERHGVRPRRPPAPVDPT
jgi:putative heme transporter